MPIGHFNDGGTEQVVGEEFSVSQRKSQEFDDGKTKTNQHYKQLNAVDMCFQLHVKIVFQMQLNIEVSFLQRLEGENLHK